MNKKLIIALTLIFILIVCALSSIAYFYFTKLKPQPGIAPDSIDIATDIEINGTSYGDESDRGKLTDNIESILGDIGYQGLCIVLDEEIDGIKASSTWYVHSYWASKQKYSISLPDLTQPVDLEIKEVLVLGENEDAFQILITDGNSEWSCWAVHEQSNALLELINSITSIAGIEIDTEHDTYTSSGLQVTFKFPKGLDCSFEEMGQGLAAEPNQAIQSPDDYISGLSKEVQARLICKDGYITIIKNPATPKYTVYFDYTQGKQFVDTAYKPFTIDSTEFKKTITTYSKNETYIYTVAFEYPEDYTYFKAPNGNEYFIGYEVTTNKDIDSPEVNNLFLTFDNIVRSVEFTKA
ncbi:MAG: hypothetical protein PHS44_05365 [Candidatus Dojkabacteria bacterium]|nr:hypothetical protein [Candidatus Dojkabacteria bacterium]